MVNFIPLKSRIELSTKKPEISRTHSHFIAGKVGLWTEVHAFGWFLIKAVLGSVEKQ